MARHPASFWSVVSQLVTQWAAAARHRNVAGTGLFSYLSRSFRSSGTGTFTLSASMILFSCLLLLTACESGNDWDRHALTGPEANRLISSVEIKPSGAIIAPDEVGEFRAEVKSGRGTTVSRNVTWRSSDASVIEVDASGQVVAVNEGTATLEATHQGVSGSVTVDVKGKVVSIRLNQSSVVLAEGEREQLQATYIYENGAERPAKRVQWRSGDPQILDVDSDGLARGIYEGETWIYIQGRGYELTTNALVRGARVAEVEIGAPRSRIEEGESVQFWADVWDEAGNRLSRPVQWSTSNAAVASVDQEGRVTGGSSGQATITASSGGESDSETIEVVTVSSTSSSDADGGDSESSTEEGRPAEVGDLGVSSTGETSATLRFTQVDDGTGNPANYDVRYATKPITWSSATSVAKGTCKVPLSGTAIGQALSCTVEGLQPSTAYEFQLVPYRGTLNEDAVFGPLSNVAGGTTDEAPITVEVLPSGVTLEEDQGEQLTATVTDAYGNELDESVSWSSTRTSVATVSSSGYVEAVAAGDAEIRATADGVTGSSQITVSQPETTSSTDDGGSAPADRPNEPSGFTRLAEFDYSTAPSSRNMSVGQDSYAPRSPSLFVRATIPEGYQAGQGSIGRHQYDFPEQRELYVAKWVRLPGADWENQAIGTKLIYFNHGYENSGGASALFIRNQHTSDTHIASSWGLTVNHKYFVNNQATREGLSSGGWVYSHKDALKVGPWHLVEMYLKLNTPDNFDGVYKLWIDGVLVASSTQMRYISPSNDLGFVWVKGDYIWGGTTGVKTRDDHIDIDHIYISGKAK